MTSSPTPRRSRRERGRPQGFSLIAASNLLILAGIIVLLSGVAVGSSAVTVIGVVMAAVAVVLSVVHGFRRRRRMGR